jgi:soluble lytic murein transglycosylase-like protein
MTGSIGSSQQLGDTRRFGPSIAPDFRLMPDELASTAPDAPPVGLRHHRDRRIASRRAQPRETPDRRRCERRRQRFRSLLLTTLALVAPHQLRQSESASLSAGPHVSTTIDTMILVPPKEAYEGIIREASALYRVDADLIRSVMQAESDFDPSAVSRTGAMGLMQLMPSIAEAFGVEHPFDPRENIMAGTRLLRELLDRHGGNLVRTIASYNAGPTAVAHYRGVPPFKETRGYVKRVTHLIAEARNAADD